MHIIIPLLQLACTVIIFPQEGYSVVVLNTNLNYQHIVGEKKSVKVSEALTVSGIVGS